MRANNSYLVGEQHDDIAAFDYQPQPLVSEYMKVL